MPFQVFRRNNDIPAGAISLPENNISDPCLDDQPGTKRTRPGRMDGAILRIDACQIEIRADRLVAGTVQQRICFCMNCPADIISLSLMHIQGDSWTMADITTVFISSGRTIVSGRNNSVVFDNDSTIFSFDTGTSVCESFCAVQVCIFF